MKTILRTLAMRPAIRRGLISVSALAIFSFLLLLYDSPSPRQTSSRITGNAELLDGQWNYLPGAIYDNRSLRIIPAGFSIVEQNGSGGQANPPVNLFGTHLNSVCDITITAQLQNTSGKMASLQFYGEVPTIADEFRIERKSVQLTINDSNLRLKLWDGTKQEPIIDTSYALTGEATKLQLQRKGGQLVISVNGKTVSTVPEHGIFSSNHIWFGAESGNGEWTLSSLKAEGISGSAFEITDVSRQKTIAQDTSGLQALASKKRPDFTIGAAMALAPAVADPDYAAIAFGGNFGSLTTENALKWQFVHPQPGHYDFHEADALAALAKRHNMQVHGHTLIFGEANPRWVQDLEVAATADKQRVEQFMVDHIKTVVDHYKGQISSWDVVNEPLADYDHFERGGAELRAHKWHQAMGEGYITKAFQTARSADPNAQLFINEYGLEASGERWDAFIELLARLKKQGAPIDGVGFQAHIYEPGDHIDPAVLRAHIQQLARMGLKARISEIDVYSEGGPELQAVQFTAVFKACLAEPTCVSFTSWGVSDRYDIFKDDNGQIVNGQDLLWGDSMQPTPAMTQIQKMLKKG